MNTKNIVEIQELMEEGKLSSKELTEYYLNRIAQYDKDYNTIAQVSKTALDDAIALDEERRYAGPRSLLHGIPVLLKDNINVDSNDLYTTAGAVVLEELHANYDATIVKKLKEAGAVILGKTNLTEFANFISDDSPNGFSALKGQVKNPYGPFDVGGSSSGSGAAVALDFCQVAIGTETSGSILSPAFSNSVVGVKPTVGLVSRYGIIPISSTQDIAGPMARNVIDTAITLNVIHGKDKKDVSTYELDEELLPDYLACLCKQSLEGVKIGVPRGYFVKEVDEATLKVYEKAIDQLKILGAEVIDVEIDRDEDQIDWDVLYYEFPITLAEYFKTLGDRAPVTSLEEIISYNKEVPETRLPYDQNVFERSVELQEDYKEKYTNALDRSVVYGKEIDVVMKNHDLDVLLFVNVKGADIAARVGYPSVTIPAGYTAENKPVGITFTGTGLMEDKLLSYAYTYEQATHLWRSPL